MRTPPLKKLLKSEEQNITSSSSRPTIYKNDGRLLREFIRRVEYFYVIKACLLKCVLRSQFISDLTPFAESHRKHQSPQAPPGGNVPERLNPSTWVNVWTKWGGRGQSYSLRGFDIYEIHRSRDSGRAGQLVSVVYSSSGVGEVIRTGWHHTNNSV